MNYPSCGITAFSKWFVYKWSLTGPNENHGENYSIVKILCLANKLLTKQVDKSYELIANLL